jgi:hypothetical protein
MRKVITSLLSLFFLLVFSFSCRNEESPSPAQGKATFSLSQKARDNGRASETTTPAFVLLSIKDSKGKSQENIKLPLFSFGQSYLSEDLQLQTGIYQLTQFVVLNAANKVMYATPMEGSDLAKHVTDPLPIDFVVTENRNTQVVPQVLAVLQNDEPSIFGYASFGFEVVKKKNKLDYYIESYNIGDLGFDPALKVVYEYNEVGNLRKYTILSYNPNTKLMEEQRNFVFSYSGSRVEFIKGYLPNGNDPYVEYSYQYLPNGTVSKIVENNLAASGIDSEAGFMYSENGIVKASYTYSNGGSFEYEFDYASGNVVTDKTTRGSQLCSAGKYTYDKHNNPFKELGYTDYLLTNLSVNNKLTEDINYVGCSFPSFIPESHTYEYNDNGYPISVTTYYKNSLAKSKKQFFYK